MTRELDAGRRPRPVTSARIGRRLRTLTTVRPEATRSRTDPCHQLPGAGAQVDGSNPGDGAPYHRQLHDPAEQRQRVHKQVTLPESRPRGNQQHHPCLEQIDDQQRTPQAMNLILPARSLSAGQPALRHPDTRRRSPVTPGTRPAREPTRPSCRASSRDDRAASTPRRASAPSPQPPARTIQPRRRGCLRPDRSAQAAPPPKNSVLAIQTRLRVDPSPRRSDRPDHTRHPTSSVAQRSRRPPAPRRSGVETCQECRRADRPRRRHPPVLLSLVRHSSRLR